MCVIIHLLEGKEFPSDKLFNSAANNWHGWGIIIKRPGENLQVIKELPQNGTHKDIDRIQRILDDNKEFERFIHFRYSTKGATSLDNCHPFTLVNGADRQCYMMHNGTYHTLGSYNSSGDSDTKELVDKWLVPTLKKWNGDNGAFDYTDKDWIETIFKPHYTQKGGSSRLLFVSNNLGTYKVGDWKTLNDAEGNVIAYTSNDEYFDKVTRGPFFEEQKRKEREAANTNSGGGVNKCDVPELAKYHPLMFQQDESIIRGLKEIFLNQNLETEEIAELSYLAFPEWLQIVTNLVKEQHLGTIAAFIDYLVTEYNELNNDFSELEDKKHKAEKHIEELMKERKKAA